MAANPMASRSAALAGAAQALNKPKAPGGGRQDLSGASNGTIQGAHGGVQQLGKAAMGRLGGMTPSGQTPPIIAPNTAGGGLTPDALKQPGVGFTKPMALPGFMSAQPKPDPGMQVFGDDAKVPMSAPNDGGVPPMPPELAQMLSERLSPGGMGSGSPQDAMRGVRDQMTGGGIPGMNGGMRSPMELPPGVAPPPGVHSWESPGISPGDAHDVGGKLPGFMPAPGGPMGAIPGPRPKPGMPTKPLPMDQDAPGGGSPPPPGGGGGGVWGQIAGGRRNNMASY